MKNALSYAFQGLVYVVIIALIAMSFWLPGQIPHDIVYWIGRVFLTLLGTSAVAFIVMWTLAQGMRS